MEKMVPHSAMSKRLSGEWLRPRVWKQRAGSGWALVGIGITLVLAGLGVAEPPQASPVCGHCEAVLG